MKLFQRIFATFCMVIIFAIAVASFSFWLVQSRLDENHFKQNRNMEISLLANALTAFQAQGEQAVRDLLERWRSHPAAKNIIVVASNSKEDILKRDIDTDEINRAYDLAMKNPTSNLAMIYYDPFGEEYLFFIRNFDKTGDSGRPATSLLLIPGLPLEPVWHEFIVFAATLAIGLMLAYILAANIIKPIRILGSGMNRLAAGDLDARVSQQLDDRHDELSTLGEQFDQMAAQLQKLVARERHLLHHVSHEMRSPLARIQAIIGLMQAQPQKQESYIARLETELTRMDNLVGELLTLSRLETANVSLAKEPLPVIPLLRQLTEDSEAVTEQHGHRIELDTGNLDENARLNANESYLYRAFDNVIRNAMNYSPEGSTIRISVHEDRKNLHIEITDNGPGIKEEQLPHIFTAFYRADSSGNKPGTGLGLALTKHIIEQHNGKVTAENAAPNGLKIHFILPKTDKDTKKNRIAAEGSGTDRPDPT